MNASSLLLASTTSHSPPPWQLPRAGGTHLLILYGSSRFRSPERPRRLRTPGNRRCSRNHSGAPPPLRLMSLPRLTSASAWRCHRASQLAELWAAPPSSALHARPSPYTPGRKAHTSPTGHRRRCRLVFRWYDTPPAASPFFLKLLKAQFHKPGSHSTIDLGSSTICLAATVRYGLKYDFEA